MIVRGTHHLLSDHDNSLDREASVAMIEEVFQTGTEQVDNQDVVKTLLPEVVDIGDASCNQSEPGNLTNTIATRYTHGIRPGSYMSDIHHEAVVHHSCEVPSTVSMAKRRRVPSRISHTNLIATC